MFETRLLSVEPPAGGPGRLALREKRRISGKGGQSPALLGQTILGHGLISA
jgi:hypothetical protein